MTVELKVSQLRNSRLEVRDRAVSASLQGVTKARIRLVLRNLARETEDMIDAVFALLDDETPSLFPNSPYDAKLCDGATTAHIGAHVSILQRGIHTKLDREGRDYWIKPLRELGAIDPIYLDPKARKFVPGHPKPKSPNSCYRLSEEFVDILKAPKDEWAQMLSEWASGENVRKRALLQAEAHEISASLVEGGHRDLIESCVAIYVPTFLSEFSLLFTDYEDGERVTPEDKERLSTAGIELGLGDPMPDVLLWNPDSDVLWVIEAVTSDGEVDEHKVAQVLSVVRSSGKAGCGFTTAYYSWRDAARRQSANTNIAPSTYVWIANDPAKQYLVSEVDDQLRVRGLR
ncbi:MAG: hypothetical protein A2Z21_01215 [Candidatus Fraserbacteria bacterium RBG_16_55_9]|uniref:BsuBI/PstI restriction endonuclease domain-containing protein n=1 Tax=Fraserbacteria sp. (strain RBG_16_55_9) TaxID=1817864 RepID=A0A1F5UZM7_FRAXR|nr:MAG: hypothetical protein A2Z21_01215 [Candidatus Fraserbacteria bacterium RBG_16_55_9]